MFINRISGAVALCLLAAPAFAQTCRIDAAGARCVLPPDAQQVALEVEPVSVPVSAAAAKGDILERGSYNLLLNPEYYGLPPTNGEFVYVKLDQSVFAIDWTRQEVLEDVTPLLAANW